MTQLPSTTWRTLAYNRAGEPLPRGLDAAWDAAAGIIASTVPRRRLFLAAAGHVMAMDKEFSTITDAALRQQAHDLRELFRRERQTRQQLLRAFAVVREVAQRQLGMKPFLVQVAGALALEAGCIAEMATGEGKTLTATMPATIAGFRGRGCHVITFNDYLAKRDAEWMKPVYDFCGLSVGYIEAGMSPADRRQAYQADITYCTNKEVTADFLRDRLTLGRMNNLPAALVGKIVNGAGTDQLVMRGLHAAIADEADSILIDEAVTPLIISGEAPNPEQVEAFVQAVKIATQLQDGPDFRTNFRYHEVDLTDAGKHRIAELTEDLKGRWSSPRWSEERITQALTADQFYRQGKQYLVNEEGKVVIVDEFTGRPMPDREWRDGLHQAVEAKEGLTVNPPKDTYARVSFQRFFRLYRKLSGMTGTAAEARREFWQIYHLPVVVIPTNRPCVRKRLPDRVFGSEAAKWAAIVERIKQVNAAGRPILVGTRSVRASLVLSDLLTQNGLEHEVLNAVRLAEEAQIIAGAGNPGRITVATNMAGRGTDIKLGRGVADQGGLHVIATERHEAGRIDRQLYGRSARQGDPGSAEAIVALDDELPRRYSPHISGAFRKRFGETASEVSSVFTRSVFEMAQHRAQRIALAQRKGVLHTDDWLDENLGFAGRD